MMQVERVYPRAVQTGDVLILSVHGGTVEAIVTDITPEGRTWLIETVTTEGVLVDRPSANAKVTRKVQR